MATKGRVSEALKQGEMIIPVAVRLFVCTDHDGFNGSASHRASVVVAKDETHARELLDKALQKIGLMPHKRSRYRLSEIPLSQWSAEVLADGSM